jgi:hypothetical protein
VTGIQVISHGSQSLSEYVLPFSRGTSVLIAASGFIQNISISTHNQAGSTAVLGADSSDFSAIRRLAAGMDSVGGLLDCLERRWPFHFDTLSIIPGAFPRKEA